MKPNSVFKLKSSHSSSDQIRSAQITGQELDSLLEKKITKYSAKGLGMLKNLILKIYVKGYGVTNHIVPQNPYQHSQLILIKTLWFVEKSFPVITNCTI